jgi:hypothetical protein
MTMREKVDDITRYMRDCHRMSPGEFIVARMTEESEDPGKRTADWWSQSVCEALARGINIVQAYADAHVIMEDAISVHQARGNMRQLMMGTGDSLFGAWNHRLRPDLGQAVKQAQSHAPDLYNFLSAVCAPQRQSSIAPAQGVRIAVIVAMMCNLMARNSSNYILHLIGNNMFALGLQKRGIEFLHAIGCSVGYKGLLEDRQEIAKASKASESLVQPTEFYSLIL